MDFVNYQLYVLEKKTQRQTPLNEGFKNGQVIDYKKKLLDILGILKNGSKFRFAEGF